MKKLIAVIVALLSIICVQAQAVDIVTREQLSSPDYWKKHEKENCLSDIRSGEDNYRKGAYNTAIFDFERAQRSNDRNNGEFYSSRELQKKIDNCHYAIKNGKTREDAAEDTANKIIDSIFGGRSRNKNQSQSQSSSTNSSQSSGDELVQVEYMNNVYMTFKSNAYCKLSKVVATKDKTIVEFDYYKSNNGKSGYVRIRKDSYIKDRKTNNKIYLTDTEGIGINPNKTDVASGEMHTFRLIFGPVSENCEEIDVVEPNGNWGFYHVKCPARTE